MHPIIGFIRLRVSGILYLIGNLENCQISQFGLIPNERYILEERYTAYPCYGITQHHRFECVKYHRRISVYLQFTKYGLVFIWYVVTANKFRKGAFVLKIPKTMMFSFPSSFGFWNNNFEKPIPFLIQKTPCNQTLEPYILTIMNDRHCAKDAFQRREEWSAVSNF